MKNLRLNRRTVLRGLLGGAAVAVGLPALEIFLNASGTAYAGGDAFPKRFGIFFWGNGILPERWDPTRGRARVDALRAARAARRREATRHRRLRDEGLHRQHGARTARARWACSRAAPFATSDTSTFAVPSIDQVIANDDRRATRAFARSRSACSPGGESLSYNGPHSINPPETVARSRSSTASSAPAS